MKNMISGNIKCWIQVAQKNVVVALLVMLGYMIFFNILGNNYVNYAIVFGIVLAFVLPLSYMTAYLPVVISMGCTRKDATLGLQVAHLVTIVEIYAFILVYSLFVYKEYVIDAKYYFYLIAYAFAAIGVSQLCGCVAIVFGRKWMIIITVICGILVGANIVGVILVALTHSNAVLYLDNSMFMLIANVVGIVIYVISIFVVRKSMNKYEVRYV